MYCLSTKAGIYKSFNILKFHEKTILLDCLSLTFNNIFIYDGIVFIAVAVAGAGTKGLGLRNL